MPQNTPMKRQFTTIDGRTVMSNLPQHWGGNDWAITGVDNPLPVGNYVQTESGVWIPQKGSDDGAADVRVTGSIVELHRVDNVTITAGSVYTTSMIDLTDVKKVFAVARSTEAISQKFSFQILWSHSSRPTAWLGITDKFESESSSQYGDSTVNITGGYLDIKAPYARFRISNTTEDDDVYLLIVLGVV